MSRSALPTIITLLVASLFSACSHYQLGTPAELPFKTVYVAPAANESFAPQVQAVLSQQIADALLREGVKLAGESSADATLEVTITRYERDASATQSGDTALAESFNLIIDATATLTNSKTGEAYFTNRPHSSNQHAFIEGGFQTSEYQATPVLLERLAQQIKNSVVSVW